MRQVICLIPMMVVTLILMAVGGSYKAAHENGYDLTKPSLRQVGRKRSRSETKSVGNERMQRNERELDGSAVPNVSFEPRRRSNPTEPERREKCNMRAVVGGRGGRGQCSLSLSFFCSVFSARHSGPLTPGRFFLSPSLLFCSLLASYCSASSCRRSRFTSKRARRTRSRLSVSSTPR